MSFFLVWFAIVFSLVLICKSDWSLLRLGLPSLGVVVTLMYSLTYGIGWTLWRFDPSSLFGYGSASTLGSLNRLGFALALGLPSLVVSYVLVRNAIGFKAHYPFLVISERYRLRLQQLSFVLVALSVIGLVGLMATGMFLRDPQQQQQALQTSWFARMLIGTGLMSRLAPVGLVLVPFAWSSWSRLQRGFVVFLLSTWTVLVVSSTSRGQLLALPLYLLIGAVIWQRLRLKHAVLLLLLGALLFLPVAEVIRVQREGDVSNPALRKTFETFQIGKQLMGTSHEFYLFLQPDECASDLAQLLENSPTARILAETGVSSYSDLHPLRWHIVGRYQACASRNLSIRYFQDFGRLPLGLLPRSLGFSFESLFDGQLLSKSLSSSLDLKPGEISYSTLSLFADAWWRWRWLGVAAFSSALGVMLALIQALLLLLLVRQPLAGLLGQLLVLTLVGTWINNTSLTMIWFLFWDLPKAWVELFLLTVLLGFRIPRASS